MNNMETYPEASHQYTDWLLLHEGPARGIRQDGSRLDQDKSTRNQPRLNVCYHQLEIPQVHSSVAKERPVMYISSGDSNPLDGLVATM